MVEAQPNVPRIFVSHSHEDAAYCRAFVEELRTAGVDVWYDEHNLGWGELREQIQQEMKARQHFIVIFSPHSVSSEWVNMEISAALRLKREGSMKTFLPVVAAACDVPLLLDGFRRIQGRDGGGVSTQEAAARIANILRPSGEAVLYAAHHPPPSEIPPDRFPLRLAQLGFVGKRIGDVEVIVPPITYIPAGAFQMGSDASSGEARPDESPVHAVELGAFAIGRFPVTVAEYACFVRTGHRPPEVSLDGTTWDKQLQCLDYPVVCVTWHDAHAYAEWLKKLIGEGWRLPTEAEWEKAARWDDEVQHARRYPWGDTFIPAYCNTMATSVGPRPVGSYPGGMSPQGAFEMSGGAWEWTSTLKRPYLYVAGDGREDTQAEGRRILRGGSWENDPRCARAAYRDELSPILYDHVTGFRLARGEP